MREMLMRLCEDSAFMRGIRNLEPEELSYGQALTLNLARILLLGTCYPNSATSIGRLVREVRRLQAAPEDQQRIIETMRDFRIDEEDVFLPESGLAPGEQRRPLFRRPITPAPGNE